MKRNSDDSIKQKPQKDVKKFEKRIPKAISDSHLRNVALYYLQRYASTSANLRAFLRRRVDRAAKHHETDKEKAHDWIDKIIVDYERTGLLNDQVFLDSQINSLRRKGESKRAIQMRLQRKGVPSDLIEEKWQAEDEETELNSAVRYTERKRLGSFRTSTKEDMRDKDLASLGRAGYSYEIAKKALEFKRT